ncbi:hypothetical protein [Aquimarina brevivitae]|uniref:Lipocalin-like protein n=1 Tax=Aquimarina brevivitae TaxID=323412 RepID=A0A4Q7P0P2_9FLAO|nr:hypothetical protein [Aquimarina brevivitae]RZS93366.1 hypothetical protein EV197_1944 [Aquimarina brevivitae]
MKTLLTIFICLVSLSSNSIQLNTTKPNLNVLLGEWKLDMSPQDSTDANFAYMKITVVENNSFEGEFYRKGVNIKNAKINAQLGIIYGALLSGDGSGTYHTTFYYEDGILHGTTHAIDRNFLSVWKASKVN